MSNVPFLLPVAAALAVLDGGPTPQQDTAHQVRYRQPNRHCTVALLDLCCDQNKRHSGMVRCNEEVRL